MRHPPAVAVGATMSAGVGLVMSLKAMPASLPAVAPSEGALARSPLLDRPTTRRAIVNVSPACLACGSYFVEHVEARLTMHSDINGPVHRANGYAWRRMIACIACGFVASGAAVSS